MPDNKPVVKAEKPVVARPTTNEYNYKKVQSLFEARLIYTGAVTGIRYEWPTAGTVVSVRVEDIPDLLGKQVGKSDCCGGGNPNGNFVLALYQG